MAASKSQKAKNPFRRRDEKIIAEKTKPDLNIYGKKQTNICATDKRGYPTPQNRSPNEIVVDALNGFIPLWAEGGKLRWRFNETSLNFFEAKKAAKKAIRDLLGEALLDWGEANPVTFTEEKDLCDFEIVVREQDRCSLNGCVLAHAFFPDSGKNQLVIYPKCLQQSKREQIETLIHETGHIFGLRHFFADVSEQAWPSEIFGEYKRFSIMNYGHESVLTADDKADLKKLYQSAWNGTLEKINSTPIKLVHPFSATTTAIG